MKQYSFPKAERLCLQKEIETLFSAGSHAAVAFPLRAVYRRVSRVAGPPVKVLMSVPKRKRKLAVDRNRAKRQLREAYRRHKAILSGVLPPGEGVHLAFLWLSAAPVASDVVESRVENLLHRIAEKLQALSAAEKASSESRTPV